MSLPEPPPQQPVSPQQGPSFGGCALFAIGMLMLIPSGLCTAFGGVGLVMQLATDPSELVRDFTDYYPFVLITLIPLALGIVLVRLGLRIRKS
ncbi:MAG TPA: hypothetical protein VGG10_19010 [Rhizomicrobium sp.]|jgi:hypothetical protein